MAYKRRIFKTKRRNYRKTKFARRKRLGSRQNIFSFKRHFDGSTLPAIGARSFSQTLLSQQIGIEFRLDNLPGHTEFLNLFDQYRIKKIKITLTPMANVNATGSVSTVNPGMIASIVDKDGPPTALGGLSDYEQHPNCRMTPVVRGRTHTRIIYPGVNFAVQQAGGAIVSGSCKTSPWLDCGLSAISHNGVLFYIDPYGTAASAQTWQVTGTMWLQFKDPR